MIRPNKKCKKIAFSILGVPDAIQDKRTTFQKKIDHRLLFEKTARVR